MEQASANWMPAALTVMSSILSLILGVIAYLLKDMRSDYKMKQNKTDREIEGIKSEMKDLPRVYVLRDDFLRAISNLENKFDSMHDEVSDINKNISLLLGATKHE